MFFTFAFGINEDVIGVHYHKNVEFFCHDLINVVLERSQYISQSKKHHLVFKIAIVALKGHLLFIAFSNPYLIIGIYENELGETLSPT